MIETIQIPSPGGPVDIIGNKTDSSLLIGKIPYQFTFLREIGSTWRYQIAKSINELDLVTDLSFRDDMKHGRLAETSLSDSFRYILNLLSPGRYTLELTRLEYDTELVEMPEGNDSYHQTDTYGGMVEIIATQSFLDESIIEEYKALIMQGSQPIPILLTADKIDDNYILDGHHKVIAYGRLKKDARVLQITKVNCEKLKVNRGLQLLSHCGNIKPEFIEMYTEG